VFTPPFMPMSGSGARACGPTASSGPRVTRVRPATGAVLRRRAFRRRGRRGQVAPVATILGLLLVVTYIANYISTTLPAQMASNDTEHLLQVENQLGRLAALAKAVAEGAAPGTQVSQPVVLASEGVPPFAVPDPGQLVPANSSGGAAVNFTLTGPFNPPSGGKANAGHYPTTCSNSTTSGKVTGIACTVAATVTWNFSAGNGLRYTVADVGVLTSTLNFSTNKSIVAVTATGTATGTATVVGSNDTVYVNTTGGATETLTIVGSYDTIALSNTLLGTFHLLVVGNHDTVTVTSTGVSTVRLTGYGSSNGYTGTLSAGSTTNVYWNGFNINDPVSASCPYKNLANTNTIAGTAGTVTYNNTDYAHSGGNVSGWTYVWNNPPTSSTDCPYVAFNNVTQSLQGAAFDVDLFNTYIPQAIVGFDQGGVVFAQPSGTPEFIEQPAVVVNGTNATVFLPVFTSTSVPVKGDEGIATVVLRLVATLNQSWPAGGFYYGTNATTKFTVISPFGVAWQSYLEGQPATTPVTATCTVLNSPATPCGTAFYRTSTLDKVVATFTVTKITIEYALFSMQVV